MNTEQYECMCTKILANTDWYRPISRTVLENFSNKFRTIISRALFQGTIDKDTWKFLNTKDPRVPTFYALPKTHKSLIDPPGRPIISGCAGLTENASSLVDCYLSPHVVSLSSYIKDTIDLLRTLEGITLPRGTILVALDIESLYNSIPHQKGLEVVNSFIAERGPLTSRYNTFILELLGYILKHNVFVFGSSHYLQVQGVAMGTKCVPSYANLYLGGWERSLFSRDDLAPFLDKVVSWYRYIDDVLLFWTGTESELRDFVTAISDNEFNLRFTMDHSSTEIHFLDLTVSIDEQGMIFSSLYRKPTAGNTILHAGSAHPESLVNSIPYSQYLRIRRNCSRDEDFRIHSTNLYHRLKQRGYSHRCLKRAYNRVKPQQRSSLIFSKGQKNLNTPIKKRTPSVLSPAIRASTEI